MPDGVSDRRVEDGEAADAVAIEESSRVAVATVEELDNGSVLQEVAKSRLRVGSGGAQEEGAAAKNVKDEVACGRRGPARVGLHLNVTDMASATETGAFVAGRGAAGDRLRT